MIIRQLPKINPKYRITTGKPKIPAPIIVFEICRDDANEDDFPIFPS